MLQRTDFNLSWIFLYHPEKKKSASQNTRNVSEVCLTSQYVRTHEVREGTCSLSQSQLLTRAENTGSQQLLGYGSTHMLLNKTDIIYLYNSC